MSVEYDRDAVLCQLLLRRRTVGVQALAACAELQRAAKARGETPPSLDSLLVERGLVGKDELEAIVREARNAASGARTKRRHGSSSGRHPTPDGPPRRDRDGVLPGDTLGPYTVERRIAKGGMGAVFAGRDRLTGDPVALKVLAGDRARRDPDAARFLREARLACVLRHEGIVRGLGFGTDRGLRYFAMELVPGESLRQRLKRGPLAEREGQLLGARIASALAYAHERAVVHRDVKPDNILVGTEGSGAVKLCDLGLAREAGVDASVTSSGAALGTPRYMSPEQARGEKDVDARSDVYSLGVTLFHALAGRPPFPEESGIVVMSRHLFDEVPDVRTVRPELSPATAEVVRKMTRKRREDRFASMREVVQALERLAGPLPAAVPPLGPGSGRAESAA